MIFDNAMGTLAPACADGRFCVTVNMTVNFLHAQPLGTRVYVRARVVKAGRTLVFTEAEMAQTPEFAEICATVSGSIRHWIGKFHKTKSAAKQRFFIYIGQF